MEAGSVTETVGQRLRRLREAQGLSQRELSQPGISYGYISRIENDHRTPSVKALRKLASGVGVSADYLRTGKLRSLDGETSVEVRDYAERCAERGDARALVELVDRLLERLGDFQAELYREAIAATLTID